MKISCFDFTDYKALIRHELDDRGKGSRSALAQAAGCQSGYVTHVLSGNAHFSLEQAMHIARHFGYSETETDFLMLLVNYGRAGTTELRSYFLKQIQARREARQVLKSRFQPQKVLSLEHQAIYYSSWHFTAIHVGVTLPGCDTELGIAERFGLSLARVREVVQFLEQAGLIRRQGGKLEIGEMQVFLGSDSPLISKHHSNWRMRAIQSLDTYTERDLHYSAVMACTVEDAALIREKMVKTIEEIRAVVRPSKEEGCYSYCLDFFEVKPT